MTDDLGLFEQQQTDEDDLDEPARKSPKRGRRRGMVWIMALVAVLLIGGGAWYGLNQIIDFSSYDDYPGTGDSDVVIEVKAGALTGDIAASMKEKDVVASAKAFVKASEDNSKVRGVQPGFYLLKTKMSGKAAVDRILDPKARVGHLQIRGGSQLDDVKEGDKTRPGIFSLIAQASCAELNGKSTCVSVDELRSTAAKADLAGLGVPSWAIADASRAEPQRRLEGLILPGVYDVMPGSSAEELLKRMLTLSSANFDALGMPKVTEDTGFRPYEVLIMASLIEKEAIKQDFGKVSRVTYNRLAKDMRLEYDSTVNYVLDRPQVRTSGADREKTGAYNTYGNKGLPPTPISSPSKDAVMAAVKPEDGNWLYFVKCDKNGTTCFTDSFDEHKKNQSEAVARGAY